MRLRAGDPMPLSSLTSLYRRADLEAIVRVVAARYHVRIDEIRGRRGGRRAPLVDARHVAIYLAVTDARLSLHEAGRYFGGRHHTTILHARRRVVANLERDERARAEVEALREALRVVEPGA